MAKDLKFVLFLDCYEILLTEKQREYMELYYYDDLSLSEISCNKGITRQAVRDVIKRSEQILVETEEKLKFAEKIIFLRKNLDEIKLISSECDDKNISSSINLLISKCLEII